MTTTITSFRTFLLSTALFMGASLSAFSQSKQDVIHYLKGMGHGQYVFGQVATWMHNENPDMDSDNNWVHKVYEKTGKLPRYGVVTYDFEDNPFTDAEWNAGVKKMWDGGMLAGVYSWYANPSGNAWNGPVQIDQIFASGDNPTKTNFYKQMDRMAADLQWLKDRKIPVIYTPFVEIDDSHKWHAKGGKDNAIRLYRLVHDYFTTTKGLDNIIWAFHTTQTEGALPSQYPGDDVVDIIGKSAYGSGLTFTEYAWAVDEKKNHGKIIWWAELGIRGKDESPRDCFDVLKKLNDSFPELAGFVFWSDEGFYNVIGNENGKKFMESKGIVTAH